MDKKNQIDRILIIDNSLGRTGALESILNNIKAQSGKYEFHFLINAKSACRSTIEQCGINVYQLRFLELSKSYMVIFYLPILILNAFQVLRIISREKIKLVHVNDMYNMIGVMIKLFNPGIKVVYHIRLLPTSYARSLYPTWRFLVEKFADQIISVSQAVAQNFNCDPTVIYDAIEAPEQVQKTPEKSAIKLLYLANYTNGKGHNYAIEAFVRTKEKMPELVLDMYGGTLGLPKNQEYKDSLLEKIEKLQRPDDITINDYVDDKGRVFVNSDIFLNFSNSESFSMTTLEALAHGTPAIVTDCGGPAEIIEHGVSGTLVPVGDIDAMTAAIVELAGNSELRESYSINGRKRFEEKFNLEEQAKKLEAVYTSLLSTATSPPRHEAQGSAS